MTDKAIRVLIVDDSLVARETIARGLEMDRRICVVGMATNPYEARDKILELEPDVITLDVNMPKMSGIDFLRRLMSQYPLPVIVISSSTSSVIEALEAGAVDFIAKPDIRTADDLAKFLQEIAHKVKLATRAKLKLPVAETESDGVETVPEASTSIKVIALGASTGGTEALLSILKGLPATVPGIVIAQHMPAVFTSKFAERLDSVTAFKVSEAKTGDTITPGTVFVAPGNLQMRVVSGRGAFQLECYGEGQKVNGHCPSVDVLFQSIADVAAPRAMGVILTGMGHDGAQGLLAMRRKGCITIGQDEASSVVYGMPKVAYSIGAVEKQSSLAQVPSVIMTGLYKTRKGKVR